MKTPGLLIVLSILLCTANAWSQESLRDIQDRTGLNPVRSVPIGGDQHNFYRQTAPLPARPTARSLPAGLSPRAVAGASGRSRAQQLERSRIGANGRAEGKRQARKELKAEETKRKNASHAARATDSAAPKSPTEREAIIDKKGEDHAAAAVREFDAKHERSATDESKPVAPVQLAVPAL